ncbi:MAG TPA: TonB-dependent receptor [Gemmatimonadaceae bacterium]|nr:TonB-dependent receptor [Gemmatimonadaceae bacterium]
MIQRPARPHPPPRRPFRPGGALVCAGALALGAALLVPSAARAQGGAAAGASGGADSVPVHTVAGVVRAADSDAPLADAAVELLRVHAGADTTHVAAARAGVGGRFALRRVTPGAYALRVRSPGYRPLMLGVTVPTTGRPADVVARLERAPVALASVVVTPGQYGVLADGPATAQSLSRAQLEAAPQVGEDLFRMVTRLPGVAANDFSAAFRVRGGAQEELLVTLDGLELYEPFHLKDFDGALSIIDLGIVGGLDLNTGGFGARYGDRLTGVMEIRTLTPEPDAVHGEAALTLTTLRGNGRGTFAGGRGAWLLSARQGFLEPALRVAGEDDDLQPNYHDLFGKLTFAPREGQELALHALYAGDRLRFQASPDEVRLRSAYQSGYLWLTWRARVAARLSATTVLSAGRLTWRRDGDRDSPIDRSANLRVRDRRDFVPLALRQDWSYEHTPRQLWTWGVEAERLAASYRYDRYRQRLVVVRGRVLVETSRRDTELAPDGVGLAAYAAHRASLGDALTTEAGLRVDRYTRRDPDERVTGWQLSPRLAAAYAVGDRTTLRAAWGRYAQAEGVQELQVQDSVLGFAPAELAEHRVVGVERLLSGGATARLEAYERRTLRARARFTSVDNVLDLLPEVGPDRRLAQPTDGVARGVELMVRRDRPAGLSWGASYALARADETVDGRRVPRPLDQRHTLVLDAAYRPSTAWTFGGAFVYHTGWPTTSYVVEADTLRNNLILIHRVYGPRNAERLPPYHRLDLRATRYFDVGGGRLAVFVDVFNAYDHQLPRQAELEGRELEPTGEFRRHLDALLPRVPSLGVTWTF